MEGGVSCDTSACYQCSTLPIRWQVFCSLTWANEKRWKPPGKWVQERVWWAWVRKICVTVECNPSSVLFVRRTELGEKTARLHYHCLLNAGTGMRETMQTCRWLEWLWESCGGGMARVRIFDPKSNVFGYLTKGMGRWEGDLHELSKFNDRSELMLSRGVLTWVRRSARDKRVALASAGRAARPR